ncbi:MAG: hypothetical protein H6550_03980 [Chitinophagales bacterium]|nr:hypothetical protein [Chitinophagales bacterium]
MTPYLEQNWNELTAGLPEQKHKFLQELDKLYNSPDRHYHNLVHITALHRLTDIYGEQLKQPEVVRWAIWYHDAIYNVMKAKNEEKSAVLAQQHMTNLGVDDEVIAKTCDMIRATASHTLDEQTDSYDARFMLDIDLLILGAVPEKYAEYTEQVGKEYRKYPDLLYRSGRKRVLQHFLDQDRIYKTDILYQRYEQQARANLSEELERLR